MDKASAYTYVFDPNTVIIISGASGVGKTTVSRALLKKIPSILVVQEFDLIREATRANIVDFTSLFHNIANTSCRTALMHEDSLLKDFTVINKATSKIVWPEYVQQSSMLVNPLLYIIRRLSSKGVPSIIEGTNLPINILLKNDEFTNEYLNNKNMFLFHLKIDSRKEHFCRISSKHHLLLSEFANIRDIESRNFLEINSVLSKQPVMCERFWFINANQPIDDIVQDILNCLAL